MRYALRDEPNGAALAANQIGLMTRAFLVSPSYGTRLRIYKGIEIASDLIVNPRIVKSGDVKLAQMEGCLSFPGINLKVERPSTVDVEFFDIDGKRFTATLDDFIARMFQHEIDHLDGLVFIKDQPEKFQKKLLKKMKVD